MMKKLTILLISLITISMFSCQSGGTSDENTKNIPSVKPLLQDIDKRASANIESVVYHYLSIQKALVNSDSVKTKPGALLIMNDIKQFDTMILQGDHRTAYNAFRQMIMESADSLSRISGISEQRYWFKKLSDNVYGLVKTFGYKKTLYKVHCPMTFNHEGADWLSTENQVRNPYYGADMLECGTVEEAIELK